jgi:ATP-dependent helicase/nuclease subunit A
VAPSELHPIVAQMRPSPEQKPAITERGRDVAVTAGAGTGKTRTLVARYLSLLAEGLPPRSVIAITFTKKAAREMRNRVREEVRTYLEQPHLKPEERERWQDLYRRLDSARIGTIHSLCGELLRSHPAEAGIDPRFDVLEEGQASILRQRAIDETLAWAADDEDAVVLFSLLGEWELRRALDGLIERRLDAADAFGAVSEDPLADWARALESRQRQALERLLLLARYQAAVDTLSGNRATDSTDAIEMQRQAALAAATVIGDRGLPLADRLAGVRQLADIRRGGGRQGAWPGGKEQLAEVKEALGALVSLREAEGDLLELRLNELDAALAQALPVLRAAFAFACGRYQAAKEERNALDFDDLEQGAVTLLSEHPLVRHRWQREARSILVDEFQDTNARQRDLVQLLNAGEGKLFVVGDAKQSIYRFRGADVAVFRGVRDAVEQSGGASYRLRKSYRAHRELVEALNDLLRPVLGEKPQPARPWVEPFAPLLPHREEPGRGFAAPHVELHFTVGPKSQGALDRAAAALANRIGELVEGGLEVEREAETRGLDYGDVAILCLATRSFEPYENALERAGVPFVTVAGRGFYGRPEIRDLLNALRALADPTDDLALAGMLRSPAVALTDAALYRLCVERDRQGKAVSLWDVLQSKAAPLSREDGARAERALEIIRGIQGMIGRSPVADVLKELLDDSGYRAALIRAGQSRAARNVAKLLSDAHASGIVGVGEFLEYVAGLRESGAREGEARATAEGAVQIMSIHAAKGLEFAVVAIGDATRAGGGARGLLADSHLGVLLPLKGEENDRPAAYALGKWVADDQEDAELERLLYVAATRAQEKLILSGCLGLKKDGTPSRLRGFMGKLSAAEGLGLAEETICHDEEGTRALQLDLTIGTTPVSCTIYEPGFVWEREAQRVEAEAEAETVLLPPPLLEPVVAPVERADQDLMDRERIPPQRVWRVVPVAKRARAPAWVIGSIVHEALAAWRFPDDLFAEWAEARARGYGISDVGELADATRETARLLLRFREHGLYQEMDGAERRLHEVPYSIKDEGVVESGFIDSLYLARGKWTIVEFKTDRIRDEAAFESLLSGQDYVQQAQRYSRAVRRLLGEEPACLLCMLNWDEGVEVRSLERLAP